MSTTTLIQKVEALIKEESKLPQTLHVNKGIQPRKYHVLMFRADMAGCGYYRADIVAKYLNRKFADEFFAEVTVLMKPQDWASVDPKTGQVVEKYVDLFVHQRQHGKPNFERMMQVKSSLRAPQIYEVDDNLHDVSPYNTAYHTYNPKNKELYSVMEAYMSQSSGVTVTTEPLKARYQVFNKHTFVLPNSLDFEIWDKFHQLDYHHPSKHGKIVIGWAGSNTHFEDMRIVEDAIKEVVMSFDNVEFWIGGWDGKPLFNDLPYGKIKVLPWESDFRKYPATLRGFDIGLAPLSDNSFNSSKSNLKFLELAALGIPVVASAVYPYANTIIDGETGILVPPKGAVHSNWVKALKTLVNNETLRRKLGQAAKAFVRANFDIEKNVVKWAALYKEFIQVYEAENKKRGLYVPTADPSKWPVSSVTPAELAMMKPEDRDLMEKAMSMKKMVGV